MAAIVQQYTHGVMTLWGVGYGSRDSSEHAAPRAFVALRHQRCAARHSRCGQARAVGPSLGRLRGCLLPALGLSALQVSPDCDPPAPHAESAGASHVELRSIVARTWIRKLPRALLDQAPRIDASTPAERAALCVLHGNCGRCHNDVGPLAALEPVLVQAVSSGARSSAKTLGSLIGHSSRYRPHETDASVQRIVPGGRQPSVPAQRVYKHFTDPDLEAIFSYLQTIPAVHNRVPESRSRRACPLRRLPQVSPEPPAGCWTCTWSGTRISSPAATDGPYLPHPIRVATPTKVFARVSMIASMLSTPT